MNEKADTYLKRMKIRDLYDIFFLLRHVESRKKWLQSWKLLLDNFKKPIDEKDLKILILEGITPTTESNERIH